MTDVSQSGVSVYFVRLTCSTVVAARDRDHAIEQGLAMVFAHALRVDGVDAWIEPAESPPVPSVGADDQPTPRGRNDQGTAAT